MTESTIPTNKPSSMKSIFSTVARLLRYRSFKAARSAPAVLPQVLKATELPANEVAPKVTALEPPSGLAKPLGAPTCVLNQGAPAGTTVTGDAFPWPSLVADALLSLSTGGQGTFTVQASVDQGTSWMAADHPQEVTVTVPGGTSATVLVLGKERGFTHLRVSFKAAHAANMVEAYVELWQPWVASEAA